MVEGLSWVGVVRDRQDTGAEKRRTQPGATIRRHASRMVEDARHMKPVTAHRGAFHRVAAAVALLALLTVALLAGCTSDEADPPSDLDRWVFPETVQPFERTTLERDTDPQRLTADYHADAPRIDVSIDIYPAAGTSLEQEFRDSQAALKAANPGYELINAGPLAMTQRGVDQPGFGALYVFLTQGADGPTSGFTTLFLFQDGDWTIEYHATHLERDAERATALVAALIAELAWPE
jgi:hypothetical protein